MPQSGKIGKSQVKGMSVQSQNRQIRPETRPGSLVTRKVVGSNPAPATKCNSRSEDSSSDLLFAVALNSFVLGRIRAENFRTFPF